MSEWTEFALRAEKLLTEAYEKISQLESERDRLVAVLREAAVCLADNDVFSAHQIIHAALVANQEKEKP